MDLIYQYWDGPIRTSVRTGSLKMSMYAERIGAKYLFEDNPRWIADRRFGKYSAHFGALKPVFDPSFDLWDKILFADTDVFPVDFLDESIFDSFDKNKYEMGICTEPFQPHQRTITTGRITSKSDELWAKMLKKELDIDLPRNEDGLLKVYNSGVVLYSKEARERARVEWLPIDEYVKMVQSSGLIDFYRSDQPYIHAMMTYSKQYFGWNVLEMDNGWNSYIHGTRDIHQPKRRIVDHRDKNTKFVHCQFPGADDMTAGQLWKVVNLPRDQWDYDI
jgi:hypothetical protein